MLNSEIIWIHQINLRISKAGAGLVLDKSKPKAGAPKGNFETEKKTIAITSLSQEKDDGFDPWWQHQHLLLMV